MLKLKNICNKISKPQLVTGLILVLFFTLLLSIGIPTLARFKNRTTIIDSATWDGQIATSFKQGSGTSSDPFVISNGSELAFFSSKLETDNFKDLYVVLEKDIILNKGIFKYEDNLIKYELDNKTYYVLNNKYYSDELYENEVGILNVINSLNNFKGTFDGNSYTIYGFYSNNENEENALFTNLEGNILNLYLDNSLIYGGSITSGIVSSANNSNIKNALFKGTVVGKSLIEKNKEILLDDIEFTVSNIEDSYTLELPNSSFGNIISAKLKGNYLLSDVDDTTKININDKTLEDNSFVIDLEIDDESVIITAVNESEINNNLIISDLVYEVTYQYGITSGIVADSINTKLNNIVNKGSIYGEYLASGIIGKSNDTTITNAYNQGFVSGNNYSSGIISFIDNGDNEITRVYNSGVIEGINSSGIINNIENSNLKITNIFNITDDYMINNIYTSNVVVNDSYYIVDDMTIYNGVTTGNFTQTNLSTLTNKTNMKDVFNEFISIEEVGSDDSNVWVYEKNSLPILYIDDSLNPLINLYANTYLWNNYSSELNTYKFDKSINLRIENVDELSNVKEKYYYISNSKTLLSKEELDEVSDWKLYTEPVEITDEGFYIIYVKVITEEATLDSEILEDISYVNSDLLVLDLSGATANISLSDTTWNSLRETLQYKYINNNELIKIDAIDELSGINTIEYYITDEILTNEALEEVAWTKYNEEISIDSVGKYIVYAKIVDNCNYTTYINTDIIIYDGYKTDIKIGRNSLEDADNLLFTNDSILRLNVNYEGNLISDVIGKHKLISNMLLPKGVKLTLLTSSKVYEYEINTSEDIYNYNNSCDNDVCKFASYPLELFKLKGNVNDLLFTESNGINNESYSFIIDFKNAEVTSDYNLKLYMNLYDQNDLLIRPTLEYEIKEFTILSSNDFNPSLYLKTDYNGSINYNSDSINNINIDSGITYKYLNNVKIFDTSIEDKKIGIAIELVDSNGLKVDKEYLKNMIFKVDNEEFYPSDDSVIRINYNKGITDVSKTLTIITHQGGNKLKNGSYKFNIYNFISYDGTYYDDKNSSNISIPVDVSNTVTEVNYGFDVIMNEDCYIINKENEFVDVDFDILQNGNLTSPNIRVSLYKKYELTAYNQIYSLVDLNEYVSNELTEYIDKVYFVTQNPIQYNDYTKLYNEFSLNLITENFENTGYKFVFDLYDDDKKIGTIEKKFIVRG